MSFTTEVIRENKTISLELPILYQDKECVLELFRSYQFINSVQFYYSEFDFYRIPATMFRYGLSSKALLDIIVCCKVNNEYCFTIDNVVRIINIGKQDLVDSRFRWDSTLNTFSDKSLESNVYEERHLERYDQILAVYNLTRQ